MDNDKKAMLLEARAHILRTQAIISTLALNVAEPARFYVAAEAEKARKLLSQAVANIHLALAEDISTKL